MSFTLAIDQGTTGSKAMLIEQKSVLPVAQATHQFTQHYPSPGLVEHDLEEILTSIREAISSALKLWGGQLSQITSVGITNQRETICAWDRISGKPLAKALVWQDRRTASWCQERKQEFSGTGTSKTGLPLDPYFSGSKMKWLLESNKAVKKAADKGTLCLGTIESFLLFKLSGGEVFATDASNASRTLLMDIDSGQWDDELLHFFSVSKETLPRIIDSFGEIAETKGFSPLPEGVPIHCALGDQQAALVGQACTRKGEMKCTYGTGAFALIQTGQERLVPTQGLLSTVGYRYKGDLFYALEGSSYIAGAAVQWLRDQLGILSSSPESEEAALRVTKDEEMKNLLFFPYLSGIGSPYWIPSAHGAILGLTRDTQSSHVTRACLEGIALSIADIIESFKQFDSLSCKELRVDGGASSNGFLMQFQSDCIGHPILRPKVIDTTCFGAGLGAMMGQGLMRPDEVEQVSIEKEFIPSPRAYHAQKKEMWSYWQKKLFL